MIVVPGLRRATEQVEELSPARFILLVGVIAAVLRSYPSFYLEHATARTIFGLALVTDIAAAVLCWIAVRRRRYSVWMTALHVMLALDLADLLGLLLTLALLSLDARSHLVNTLVHQSLTSFLGEFVPPYLVFSPIRFAVAAMLIGIGRQLPGSGKAPVAARAIAGVSPEQ